MPLRPHPTARPAPTMATPAIDRPPASGAGSAAARASLPTDVSVLRLDPMTHGQDAASKALEDLVTRFGRLLRQVGRRWGLTEAELGELCQDVRIRIWHALASGERIAEAPASYVYRTAMSAAVDMIRRRRGRREEPFEGQRDSSDWVYPGAAVAPECEGALEEEELAGRVAAQVDQLAEPRDVVVRMYLVGYDHHTISRLLGWTEAKTRNLLYRGLADLRAKLLAQGIGPVEASDRH